VDGEHADLSNPGYRHDPSGIKTGTHPLFDLSALIFLPIFLSTTFESSDPKPDLGNCHCERSEAIPPCPMRLPRTFEVLAKTDWGKGFIL
jgi:hypothetical protein